MSKPKQITTELITYVLAASLLTFTLLIPAQSANASAQRPTEQKRSFIPRAPSPPLTPLYPRRHAAALDLRPILSQADRQAAFRAIHIALSRVGDGSTYIWQRRNGRLSGTFQPTKSFWDATGRTCRHVVIRLIAGDYVQKAEGIACRTRQGRWLLEG